ncbi:hypothetical protein LIER_29779 [Lithospermum erythrorhizon]|uniref:Uncharacterized protein n=1 Tax=Lithospermum erythrorhizon TaxID=34254 RepID=A0AAV3RLU5_LITER
MKKIKKAKIEALNVVTAASSNPQTLQTVVISLDDELTTSAQEAVGARKEKSKVPSTVHSSKAILPLWRKLGQARKRAPYSLPDERRKYPTSDLVDAFALSVLYMIKALNASYACTLLELLKDASIEKMQEEFENAQVSLKQTEEELNSAKEALSAEELMQATSGGEADHIEEFKTSEEGDLFVGKEAAAAIYTFVTRFVGGLPRLAGMYNKFKKRWPEVYFEGLSVDIEMPTEGGEVAEFEVADEQGGGSGEVA